MIVESHPDWFLRLCFVQISSCTLFFMFLGNASKCSCRCFCLITGLCLFFLLLIAQLNNPMSDYDGISPAQQHSHVVFISGISD